MKGSATTTAVSLTV